MATIEEIKSEKKDVLKKFKDAGINASFFSKPPAGKGTGFKVVRNNEVVETPGSQRASQQVSRRYWD